MSSLKTTQLVVALSLCLLLFGFSYSVEAAARPITDVAEVAANQQCEVGDFCVGDHDPECPKSCQKEGFRGGNCLPRGASSNREEKIDINYYKIIRFSRCCCYH
ncbi:hypothetical protein MKW98_019099 [Papaver atlanticum]|uniref:Uncharacterized protein n=1 Tax=Papaver atlanticum TaxID=357466 RepID=A0AAD4XYP6_9MAGN|nr:hypothetical protein MKW98_019099 [Papaver atlanticum]